MIAPITKLKEAIKQALEEINDACLDLRADGVVVLLPERVDFEVALVTDINDVTRTETSTEADGSTTTLIQQLSDDTETRTANTGEQKTVRTPTSGSETTTITHPNIQTSASGADNSDETVTYTYED